MTIQTDAQATDAQAAQALLDANPGMLWQTAVSKDGLRVACRIADDNVEVLLHGSDGSAVTLWEKWNFAMSFTLEGHLTPETSAAVDQALFSATLAGSLQTVEVK